MASIVEGSIDTLAGKDRPPGSPVLQRRKGESFEPVYDEVEVKGMAQWVRLCGLAEAPKPGEVKEAEANGRAVCLANVDGELSAVDNLCPHREGPLGQGWLEGSAVVCPWHSWVFDLKTGKSQYPVHERVDVFALKVEGEDLLVEME